MSGCWQLDWSRNPDYKFLRTPLEGALCFFDYSCLFDTVLSLVNGVIPCDLFYNRVLLVTFDCESFIARVSMSC